MSDEFNAYYLSRITPLQAADAYLHKCGKVLRSKTTLVQMRSSPVSAANELGKLVKCVCIVENGKN